MQQVQGTIDNYKQASIFDFHTIAPSGTYTQTYTIELPLINSKIKQIRYIMSEYLYPADSQMWYQVDIYVNEMLLYRLPVVEGVPATTIGGGEAEYLYFNLLNDLLIKGKVLTFQIKCTFRNGTLAPRYATVRYEVLYENDITIIN